MKKNLYYNIVASIISPVITLVCGFILPRLILLNYGSEVNGLISSINNYLGFIGLMDLGVGAVIQSLYFGPLVNRDNTLLNKIYFASTRFFHKLGIILCIYVVFVCYLFSAIIKTQTTNIFNVMLILSIAISLFGQYYFAIPKVLILNADQKYYIQALIQSLLMILNTAISVLLIRFGCSIQILKLVGSMIFLIRPLALKMIINKNYKFNKTYADKNYHIEQKWNGLAQHIATVVMDNTDIMILTVMSSIKSVSIYSVYNLVINGLKTTINATSNGFLSLFGTLYAKKDYLKLRESFDYYNWIVHFISIILFNCTMILLVPFVMLYTGGVDDANYFQPIFAILLTISGLVYCLRVPYNTIICAIGHFKATQKSAVIEPILNIVVSIIVVKDFGLAGVAIGTIVAITYRFLYFCRYVNDTLFDNAIQKQIKLTIICIFEAIPMIVIASITLLKMGNVVNSIITWFILAIITLAVTTLIIVFINTLFYKKYLQRTLTLFVNIVASKRKTK